MKPSQALPLTSGDSLATCLARQGTGRREPANSVLFRRGEPARGVYLVQSGVVELSLEAERTRKLINRTAGPGSIVGLPAAVSGEPYSLTATTLSTCDFLFVEPDRVVQLLRSDPGLALPLLETLAHEATSFVISGPKTKPAAFRAVHHESVYARGRAFRFAPKRFSPGGLARQPKRFRCATLYERGDWPVKLLIALFAVSILTTFSPVAKAQGGADVYKTKCSMCHGTEGQGKVGPALKGTKLGEDDIVLLLSKGKEGKKAPHNKSKGLSDDDTKAVAHYVKSLK